MRWFKHITDSHEDEKLALYLAEHGLEGYGFWWLLLEQVAKQVGKNDVRCTVSYPLSYWLRLSGVYHHKKFKMFVQSLDNLSLISAQCMNNVSAISELSIKDVLTISIPNLLKYRDEYSKKSVYAPDKLQAKIEIEIEIENKEERKTAATRTEDVFGDCFTKHASRIKELYPHANFEAERETCTAHYRSGPPPIDCYPVILKWFQRVPKSKASGREPPKTFEEIKMDNTKRAMAEFLGESENDGHGQKTICIDDGRFVSGVPLRLQ